MRDVSPGEVLRQVRRADPVLLGAAVLVATLGFPVRLWRWRSLLRASDGAALPAVPLWHALAIGFMANNLLPLRTGEVIRGWVAARLTATGFTTALASLAAERIFDALLLVLLLVVAVPAARLPADLAVAGVPVTRMAAGGAVVGAVVLVSALAVLLFPLAFERLVRRLVPRAALADRLVALIEGARQGLAVLRSPGRTAAVTVQSLAFWLFNAASFWLAFLAFDIPVGFWAAVLLQSVLAFGIAIPSTPGFIGPFEAVIVAVLAIFAVPGDLAFSYAIAYHLLTFVPITLLGLLSLSRTSLGLGDLQRRAAA